MTDFGTMRDQVLTDLNRGSAHSARVERAIVDAIAFYRSQRLAFNVKRETTVLEPGLERINLPDGWLDADQLRLETPDGRREQLDEVTYIELEDEIRNPDQDTGEPERFAIHARELRFAPIPDKTYTLVMSFVKDLPGINAKALEEGSLSDATTNDWMTDGWNLIRQHAMQDLLVNYIRGDAAVALAAAINDPFRPGSLPQVLRALRSQMTREQAASRIKGWL